MGSKNVGCLFLLALLATCLPTAYAAYLPLRTDMVGAKPHLQLLKHTDNEILLEIKLPGVEMESVTMEGRHWDHVEIPGGGFANDPGTPDLPSFSRLLAIPPRGPRHLQKTDVRRGQEGESGKNSEEDLCLARTRASIGKRSWRGGEKLYFRYGMERDGPEIGEDAKKVK